ncbi:hydroxyacyl-thioester dehydratase type 2, mitochondrial-like [Portunus trituberculatus]|uniref:hydroxyacyl-thioester dehydratase type 2, mitochondrial-like n=1 Tax=Portunus trituberculatus TaxID=210409 RepID=UPI001E1CCEA3|nr:hydroxyacyl-thioester dehydratase type 2, mitochondrial-like [Portunus trituberculatus]
MLLLLKQSFFSRNLNGFPLVTCGRCYSLKVGDVATLRKKITAEDIKKFSELSGDTNPVHLDKKFVESQTTFKDLVVHGAHLNSLVSRVIGTQLPGPGTLVVRQELKFPNPCYAGEEVEVTVRLANLRKIITVDFFCTATEGKIVLEGKGQLMHSQRFKGGH